MQRFSAIFILMLSLIASVGCSMCCGPDDFNYPTYGGIHQRADPASGRVGSILSDPYASVAGLSADSNLEPYPEPRGSSDAGTFESTDDDFDDDFDRAEEDMDDDLEKLDSERELETIDPLDEDSEPEVNGKDKETTTAARPRWRRRR